MSRTKIISDELAIEMANKREKEHLSYKALSDIYGFSASGIQKRLVSLLKNPKQEKISNYSDISEEIKNKVIYNYLHLGQGLEKAGVEFGLSGFMVKEILKEKEIKQRTYVEAKQTLRKYKVDDNFFKTQSPNMAYILGFLAADGNVAKNENQISIQLQKADEDFLEKIRNITKSTRPLKYYLTNAGNPTCKMSVWSSEWKKDLAIYHIVPVKTFILQPPDRLNPKYYIDYIRGYFDGDGSITVNNENYNREFKIVGASKEVIHWMYEELIKLGVLNLYTKITYTDHDVPMYNLYATSKTTIKQIQNLFYYSENVLCLERKRNKFNLIT